MRDLWGRVRHQPWLFAGLLTAILLVVNVVAEPAFAEPASWPRHLAALAPLALVAMAATTAVLSGGGGLDLSIGPLAVMCNVVLVHVLFDNGVESAWLAIPIVLLLGLVVGAINGLLSTVARYMPVVATLCVMFVIMGLNEKIGATSQPTDSAWIGSLGDMVGPVPGGLLLILAPIAIWWALGRTAFHRNLYAVGGNDVTAFTAGVDVTRTRIVAYALGGLFAAIGGLALTALVQSSQASSTNFYILVGLTAVALGGTSLGGGRGGLTGALLGASALFLMQQMLSSLAVPPTWINVVYGGMLVIGILANARPSGGGLRLPVRRPASVGAR